MKYCVIDVGHPSETPAAWFNADVPEHTVCDQHKNQYNTSWDNYDIKWEAVLEDDPCKAKIRPFFNEDIELTCFLLEHRPAMEHRGTLRNYAYEGSSTIIYWFDSDRRNFKGDWASCIDKNCVLPNKHRGSHAN